MTRYRLTTNDFLVFRDGRPFGATGTFGGSSLRWPYPQTLAGMVRTAVGFARSPDYFRGKQKEKNIAEIMKIGIGGLCPAVQKNGSRREPLLPLPADLVMTDAGKRRLALHSMTYETLSKGQGTDIANPDWLIPRLDLQEKPTRQVPFLAKWSFFREYLSDALTGEKHFSEIGIAAPVTNLRIHNELNTQLVTKEGGLFSNEAFYLKVKEYVYPKVKKDGYPKEEADVYPKVRKDGSPEEEEDVDPEVKVLDLSINFDVINDTADDISGHVWLGGERKRARLTRTEEKFPACPDVFDNQRFLKLVLTTHGDFGGWCPEWLKPDLGASSIDWVTIPKTDHMVRLRSAVVIGWDGVSGWDLQQRGPKAMKKLVRPGAVYLLEVKDPASSAGIAAHLWGKSLCSDTESRNNGYGQCVLARVSVPEK